MKPPLILSILLIFNQTLQPQEMIDLGVITPSTLVHLEKCPSRSDFAFFTIEVKSSGSEIPRTLQTTNEVLTYQDLSFVPRGRAVLGVRSVCRDGTKSPMSLFRINLTTNPPTAPKAYVSVLLSTNETPTLRQVLDELKGPNAVPPLPGGTNLSYRAEDPTKRRSQ